MGKIGLTKEAQLFDNRKQKNKTIRKKRRAKKGDMIDFDYIAWLKGNVGCVICGDISVINHAHHIEGRKFYQNDYEVVILTPKYHNLSNVSYHKMGQISFAKYWHLPLDIKNYFKEIAKENLKRYIKEGGKVHPNAIEWLNNGQYGIICLKKA
jgi:hypothetical protein